MNRRRRPRAELRPVWFRSSSAPWDSGAIYHLWGGPGRTACGADLTAMNLGLPRWLARTFARVCRRCEAKS